MTLPILSPNRYFRRHEPTSHKDSSVRTCYNSGHHRIKIRGAPMAEETKGFFKLAEFACKCGRAECDAVPVKMELLGMMNDLRAQWGKPLVITSGVRCAVHNVAVGGAADSQHMLGCAADIKVDSFLTSEGIKALARKLGFNGIGLGDRFIHLDIGPLQREWYYPARKL